VQTDEVHSLGIDDTSADQGSEKKKESQEEAGETSTNMEGTESLKSEEL
jgi:hypothetical protein